MLTERLMMAYTPMNYNVVALICQDPTDKKMTSDDVLGRIMNHEMNIQESNNIKNLYKGVSTSKKQDISLKGINKSKKKVIIESPSEEEEEGEDEDEKEYDEEEIALCIKKFQDFIVGLSRSQSGYDSIWVIVDRLTKVAHFIPVKTAYSRPQLAELYMSRIVRMHGAPKKIVSDRGTSFTSKFYERFYETLDTQLHFCSAYHPQTDGQIERVNQILEDMLRACAL
jgi:IS30 family transposase